MVLGEGLQLLLAVGPSDVELVQRALPASSGSNTCSTISLAPKWSASAPAKRSARFEQSE
jgi:hypothetical protein